MIRILDYYYLVVLRWFGDKWDYRAIGVMAFTFEINIFSMVILINHYILNQIVTWIALLIIWILINIILDTTYNKKRREKIREKYKDESEESRERGVIKVILYEILSVVFLIFVIWMIGR